MDVRARVIVRGRVQGVSFRIAVRDRARSRGLGGWVRNRPDGAVEAVFDGPEESVRSMLDWCGCGPSGARVDTVEVEWEPPAGERGFAIR